MGGSIRLNPAVSKCELLTALDAGDDRSYKEITKALGKAAKAIRSEMSKTQTKLWYEDSKETLVPLIAARKRERKCTYGIIAMNSGNSTKRQNKKLDTKCR